MRAWEPEKGEDRGQGKAWRAFNTFRDLGPGRTLKQAATIFYDRTEETLKGHEYDQVRKWSAKFDWMDRAAAYDSWLEMHRMAAVEEHVEQQAQDHAQREAALKEKALSLREKAAEQAATMLQWPLSERRLVQEAENGEQATFVVLPSRWSKQTAVSLYGMVVGDAKEPELEEEAVEYDFSNLSDEEIDLYVSLENKVGIKPKKPFREE